MYNYSECLDNDFQAFERGLVRLLLTLERLHMQRSGIKIIWMEQHPTIDFVRHKDDTLTIYSKKIDDYNAIVRQHIL